MFWKTDSNCYWYRPGDFSPFRLNIMMEFIDFETSEVEQQNEDPVFSDDENKDTGKVNDNVNE